MTSEELLLKLRDIQPPVEPPWWWLAPWLLWVLLAVVAVAVIVALAWHYRGGGRLGRLAQRELDAIAIRYTGQGDTRLLAVALARWLRQVSLLAFPGVPVKGLCGEAWLGFLDQGLDDKPFREGCGRVFGDAIYRPDFKVDPDQLLRLCRRWLDAARPSLRRGGNPR